MHLLFRRIQGQKVNAFSWKVVERLSKKSSVDNHILSRSFESFPLCLLLKWTDNLTIKTTCEISPAVFLIIHPFLHDWRPNFQLHPSLATSTGCPSSPDSTAPCILSAAHSSLSHSHSLPNQVLSYILGEKEIQIHTTYPDHSSEF